MIIDTLREREETVTFAESCTGGRIAVAFTAVSGASSVLKGSCITYSNEIKHHWLGVEMSVLQQFGAVSQECVSQMLDGIQTIAQSDYALAVSGIAGPTGGTALKPVGTVYIGIKTPDSTKIFQTLMQGNREEIQEKSVDFAIETLAKYLKIDIF